MLGKEKKRKEKKNLDFSSRHGSVVGSLLSSQQTNGKSPQRIIMHCYYYTESKMSH
jgi:hypothetical protein